MAAARKPSIVSQEMRRKSIYDRKASVERNQVDFPPGYQRRQSIDGRRMSIMDYRRPSMAGSRVGLMSADRHKNIKLENTYKLEPDEKFPIYEAKKIATSVLESNLNGIDYDHDECNRLTRVMSDRIKQQVKALGHSRYKIVVIISIGQRQDTRPSMSFTSRCIWNDKLDNFAEATFSSKQLYAVALVYALYAD